MSVQTTAPAQAGCDHRHVGVLITRGERVLLAAPPAFSAGYSPLTGHGDGRTPQEAAAMLCRRAGLGDAVLSPAGGGRCPDTCSRPTGPGEPGHQWVLYRARVDQDPAATTTITLGWHTLDQVRSLADITVAYARGVVKEGSWRTSPGLSPTWVGWLIALGLVGRLPSRDIKAVAALAGSPAGGAR